MTRRRLVTFSALALAVGSLVAPGPADAVAAESAAPRVFRNCTHMHTVYKGGVARRGARDHRSGGGTARYRPYRNTALYNANTQHDRDRDGVACEQ